MHYDLRQLKLFVFPSFVLIVVTSFPPMLPRMQLLLVVATVLVGLVIVTSLVVIV